MNTVPGAHNLYIHTSSYTQSVRRWYSGADRLSAIQYITDLVDKCHRAADVIHEGKHVAMAASLKKALSSAFTGINMLNTTYSDDSSIIAQLTLATQKINVVIQKLENTITTRTSTEPIPIPHPPRPSNTTDDGIHSPLYSSPRD